MAMKMKVTNYSEPTKQILAQPDHYVAYGFKHNRAVAGTTGLAELIDGRYIVKAGTIYPANGATAIGVILNDYDVTDGDQMMAVVIHGFVKVAALPENPSANAITALKQITFLPIAAINLGFTGTKATAAADATVLPADVTFTLSGATFRDGAETLTNWTIAGDSTVKAEVDTITISPDRKSATFKFAFVSGQTALKAGSLTVLPSADIISIGKTIPAAVAILTVA